MLCLYLTLPLPVGVGRVLPNAGLVCEGNSLAHTSRDTLRCSDLHIDHFAQFTPAVAIVTCRWDMLVPDCLLPPERRHRKRFRLSIFGLPMLRPTSVSVRIWMGFMLLVSQSCTEEHVLVDAHGAARAVMDAHL
jgi:hypothetical protein